jgi:hypothetical protein
MLPLRNVTALRYVQPLREGGSLPAVVDTDDGMFVVKFRGAGQGPKALIAELIVGMLARELELPSPDLALVQVHPSFGRSEPDPEIQDLLRASHGTNVGLRYLDGAFNFAFSVAGDLVAPDFATRLVWLDALVTNPDRTHRNPNLMVWERQTWLIDHGAALYAHHDWDRVDEARVRTPFPLIREHVLLGAAANLEAVDAVFAERLRPAVLAAIMNQVPDELLLDRGAGHAGGAGTIRDRYLGYLVGRLRSPRDFVAQAIRARSEIAADKSSPLQVRR